MAEYRDGPTRWRLLGPVRLILDGREVGLGPARQRSVMAVLLMTPGRTVPVDTLIHRVWDERPPRASNAAAPYVARLRRILDAAAPGADLGTLRYIDGGYRLDCDPDLVDLHRGRRLATEARAALEIGDAQRAADLLRRALDGWQAVALAGMPGHWAARSREALHGEWLDLLALRAEADLWTGRHVGVINDLSALVAEHPTAEGLVIPLLLAYARAGRSTEALACYAQVRKAIAEELGSEPSARLRELHVRILRDDPTLGHLDAAAALSGPAGARQRSDVPAQLPADVSAFTGRDEELGSLDAATAGAGDQPSAVVISAVAGTAGVGKTALAVRWAHRARARYPDGQLYVNLRGYDPERPMTAGDALTRFLTALGLASQDIPIEVDDRAARYRTATSDRRMLILLDNASSVEQVRPLLPGTPTCTVVVTSRDSLAGLAALHGAHRLHLDLLPAADAHALLRRLIGSRIDDEPEAATALAELCVRLPLALRVAAELVVARPDARLADLVTELTDQRQRLRLLDVGDDPRAAVRTVFSWSMRHLPVAAARTFGLLGLHPGPDFDAHTAAALADTDLDHASRALDLLARANLIHRTAPGRYGMHDLLRAYAASLTTADNAEGDAGARAALGRLFDYYLANAAAAMDCLHPAEAHRRPRIQPAAAVPAPTLTDPDTARGWLDTERPNLVAVVAYAAAHGWPSHTIRLSATLYRYLGGSHHGDALTVHGHARDVARQTGDSAAEAHAALGLGAIYGRLSQYEQALHHLREALVLYQEVGDRTGEARTLGNLGMLEAHLGRCEPASNHIQQALTLFQQAGDQPGEALALTQLGNIARRLGRYERAVAYHDQALALFRHNGNPAGEAEALVNLGAVEARLGRYGPATDHHRLAIALFRRVGERTGEGWALDGLGTVHAGLGDRDRAAEYYHQALTIFRETGDREGETYALNGLGETAQADGDPADAVNKHTAALACATETGVGDQYARAHTGLGHAHRALGDPDRAREHYELALARYTELGSPDAEGVRAHLAAVTRPANALG